ncbi:ornithine carbamoyltransferase [Candidatus Bathyarchaeota archaeon]|nr:ornithine carbamoyltransferase [Candidatus Bathyarchaeota archaeon]NIU80778.1 ornithine carbamoyltransferase [Candidatus Bathyarchaeota archaeon]NIV67403.1 ornithine carbamoyltransferase [Candidatus Bathyarchaeota archaeon]NIW15947.1 ornithine carbamoyltransferase [Candidatus Bathyarchaeota archaeon]NIW34049.1 ornithine carbamoyltransferase [Candidatus Bathyarchaeota archaeon]
MANLKNRDLLSVADLSPDEIFSLLETTQKLKSSAQNMGELLSGKILGLLFEKPSTRTRASFEAAMMQLGGEVIYMRPDELQLGRGEPVKDTARVLTDYLDALVLRTHRHQTLVKFAEYCNIPVINGLSDLEHPTQILCDMYTILEAKGQLEGLDLAWIGDGNNVCHSWLLGASLMGMNISVATPRGYAPHREILERATKLAEGSSSKVNSTTDPQKAASNADILYTDVWISMGQEEEKEKRLRAFRGYQINQELLRAAKEDAIVMHCLPAHRGMEITEAVLEGDRSVVWPQAENKLHGARAILTEILS